MYNLKNTAIKDVATAVKCQYGTVRIDVSITAMTDIQYTVPGALDKGKKLVSLPRTSNGELHVRAAAIKSQFRHHAASALKSLVYDNDVMTIDSHVYLDKGGVGFHGERSIPVLETIRTHLLDFHSRLFGSVAIRGGVMTVTDAVADPSVAAHIITGGTRKGMDVPSILERFPDLDREGLETFLEKQASAGTSETLSVQTLLPDFEVIPKGTELRGSIILNNPTKVELGLLLLALDEWQGRIIDGEELRIGGYSGKGMGLVKYHFAFHGAKKDPTNHRKALTETFLRLSLEPASLLRDSREVMTFRNEEGQAIDEPEIFRELTTITRDFVAANRPEIINQISLFSGKETVKKEETVKKKKG